MRTASVLHVGKYYPPVEGGIESHVQSLCEGLSESHDITALVFNTERRTRRETVNGVKVVRVATLGRVFSTEIAPVFIGWFLRLRRADIIHLHTPNPVGELACLLAPAQAGLVVTYHSDVVRQRLLARAHSIVLHRLMRRADGIISFTRRYVQSSPVLSNYEEKCAIIPHGVNLAELSPTPRALERAADLRREHGDRIALFVGRLVYYKGVDILLRALRELPGVKLLIVGDGPLKGDLLRLAREIGVTDRSVFLGRIDHEEKIACYHASDFLVLPATHRSEAFGVVQVEALACGLPVISTNIQSGVPFVNLHNLTGLVVEPGDPAALARAMGTLFDRAELRARYGAAARRRAQELFSREVMLRDVRQLYAEVLERRGAVGVKARAVR